jgi:TrmH family RNA methyltransferase
MAAELELRGQPTQHWNRGEWPRLIESLLHLESLAPWFNQLSQLQENPWNIRALNDLRHSIQAHLNTEAADWDLLPPLVNQSNPTTSLPETRSNSIPQVSIYLDSIRSPFNVGSMFRTAWAFGCETILLSPGVPKPDHQRVIRSSMGATNFLRWEQVEPNNLLTWCKRENYTPIALETGGPLLGQVDLPDRWMIILGSEELGVSPDLLALVERVSIPLPGSKASLNVGVSLGIGLAHWHFAKASTVKD